MRWPSGRRKACFSAPEKGSDKPTLPQSSARAPTRPSSSSARPKNAASSSCFSAAGTVDDPRAAVSQIARTGRARRHCASITLLRANEADGCRLAAAARKKLVLYKWRAGTSAESGLFEAEEGCFEPFSEVGLPEPMRWMAWGGEKQLWLALKQRYVKLSVGSLEMADVLPFTGGMGGGGGGAGGGKDKKEKEKAGDASGGGGEPLGEPLSGGEALLLAQETLGVFVDAGGKPCRGFSIALAEPPVALAATGLLFLVALHKRGRCARAAWRTRAAPASHTSPARLPSPSRAVSPNRQRPGRPPVPRSLRALRRAAASADVTSARRRPRGERRS